MPSASIGLDVGRYNLIARLLHWLIAFVVLGLIVSGLYAEDLENSPEKLKVFFWHKSFGLLILALMLVRVAWRCFRPPPTLVSASKLESNAAHAAHLGLYALLFLMPLSGWLIQSAANYPFKVFDLFSLPAIVAPSEAFETLGKNIHGIGANLLIALVSIHVLAVIYHRLASDNSVWFRMALPRPLAAVLVLGWGIVIAAVSSNIWLGNQDAARNESAINVADGQAVNDSPAAVDSILAPLWVQGVDSRLGFSATYDDIAFQGEFENFDAKIAFDPQNLPGSRFIVDVDVTSANTNDSTRDEALAGEDWFDYEQFPLARYDARSFSLQPDGSFVAKGRLTIKEFSRPLSLSFRWNELDDGTATLEVDASLSRIEFGVGSGMWADPIVGHKVMVESFLRLSKAN